MDPLNPQTPDPKNASEGPEQSGAGHIDLNAILLPKKETPGKTVLSAERINAGVLLEQEVAAGTDGTHAEEAPQTAAPAPASPAKPAVEESSVASLETFQRDIEKVVTEDKVSVLSIATAEANRRSGSSLSGAEPAAQTKASFWRNTAMIAAGVLFLVAASGALAYLVTRPTSVPGASPDSTSAAPFISVDAVKEITITPDETRDQVMNSLNAARLATSLPLGLMAQLFVTESSTTASGDTVAPLGAQDFLTLMAPNLPASLARAFEPSYLLGVHVYDGNQAFMILSVYSYEQAYSGMLEWEAHMEQDLLPLFSYTPSPRIPEEGVATTSAATSSQQFIQTGFVDKILENHDARVLENSSGDVYLLWTFLDRNTLVIATNDATLREIIARLKNAPIVSVPGQ